MVVDTDRSVIYCASYHDASPPPPSPPLLLQPVSEAPQLNLLSSVAKAASAWGMAAKGGPASKQIAYDPESFYVRATDNRGHREKLSFGCPPEVYAQVMKFVGDEQFAEYDSPADVFRDAVVHLMAKRRDQLTDPTFREGIDRVHRDLQHWKEIDAMFDQATQWQVSLDKVRKAMVDFTKDKAWEQMETSLHRLNLMVETMGEPYAGMMREEIATWTKKLPSRP